jgi:hypothetical protein
VAASSACEHAFVTAQGGPYPRFRRALATGNPTIATAAAAELPRLSLGDALELLLLYRDSDRRRFERAAVRWHGRLCLEVSGLVPADAGLALAALRGLGDGEPLPAGKSLAALLSAYGLGRESDLVKSWLTQMAD